MNVRHNDLLLPSVLGYKNSRLKERQQGESPSCFSHISTGKDLPLSFMDSSVSDMNSQLYRHPNFEPSNPNSFTSSSILNGQPLNLDSLLRDDTLSLTDYSSQAGNISSIDPLLFGSSQSSSNNSLAFNMQHSQQQQMFPLPKQQPRRNHFGQLDLHSQNSMYLQLPSPVKNLKCSTEQFPSPSQTSRPFAGYQSVTFPSHLSPLSFSPSPSTPLMPVSCPPSNLLQLPATNFLHSRFTDFSQNLIPSQLQAAGLRQPTPAPSELTSQARARTYPSPSFQQPQYNFLPQHSVSLPQQQPLFSYNIGPAQAESLRKENLLQGVFEDKFEKSALTHQPLSSTQSDMLLGASQDVVGDVSLLSNLAQRSSSQVSHSPGLNSLSGHLDHVVPGYQPRQPSPLDPFSRLNFSQELSYHNSASLPLSEPYQKGNPMPSFPTSSSVSSLLLPCLQPQELPVQSTQYLNFSQKSHTGPPQHPLSLDKKTPAPPELLHQTFDELSKSLPIVEDTGHSKEESLNLVEVVNCRNLSEGTYPVADAVSLNKLPSRTRLGLRSTTHSTENGQPASKIPTDHEWTSSDKMGYSVGHWRPKRRRVSNRIKRSLNDSLKSSHTPIKDRQDSPKSTSFCDIPVNNYSNQTLLDYSKNEINSNTPILEFKNLVKLSSLNNGYYNCNDSSCPLPVNEENAEFLFNDNKASYRQSKPGSHSYNNKFETQDACKWDREIGTPYENKINNLPVIGSDAPLVQFPQPAPDGQATLTNCTPLNIRQVRESSSKKQSTCTERQFQPSIKIQEISSKAHPGSVYEVGSENHQSAPLELNTASFDFSSEPEIRAHYVTFNLQDQPDSNQNLGLRLISFPRSTVKGLDPFCWERIVLSLKSGLLSEINWALDVLLIISHKIPLFLKDMPMHCLLDSLLNVKYKQLQALGFTCSSLHRVAPLLPVNSYGYIQTGLEKSTFCEDNFCGESAVGENLEEAFGNVRVKENQIMMKILCVSTLLLNFSFVPDNSPILAKNERVLVSIYADLCSKKYLSRVNALVTLANLAGHIELSMLSSTVQALLLRQLFLVFLAFKTSWTGCYCLDEDLSEDEDILYLSRLSLEILIKLLVVEGNTPIVLSLAGEDYLGAILDVLCFLIGQHQGSEECELAMILLTDLSADPPLNARIFNRRLVSTLLGFLESCRPTGASEYANASIECDKFINHRNTYTAENNINDIKNSHTTNLYNTIHNNCNVRRNHILNNNINCKDGNNIEINSYEGSNNGPHSVSSSQNISTKRPRRPTLTAQWRAAKILQNLSREISTLSILRVYESQILNMCLNTVELIPFIDAESKQLRIESSGRAQNQVYSHKIRLQETCLNPETTKLLLSVMYELS